MTIDVALVTLFSGLMSLMLLWLHPLPDETSGRFRE